MTDSKKKMAICPTCGSAAISHDATAYWNDDEQSWELTDCCGVLNCQRCDCETKWGADFVDLDTFEEPHFYDIRAMIEKDGDWIHVTRMSDLDGHNPLNVEFCVYTRHDDYCDQTATQIGDYKNIEEAIQAVRDRIGKRDFDTMCPGQPSQDLMELPRVYQTENNEFILTTWDFETELSPPVEDADALRSICAAILKIQSGKA